MTKMQLNYLNTIYKSYYITQNNATTNTLNTSGIFRESHKKNPIQKEISVTAVKMASALKTERCFF